MNWVKFNPIVQTAYDFAKRAHQGQKRKNGVPYFEHLERTAERVAEWGLDEATIAAAFLHDILEDTAVAEDELTKKFGAEIVFLVKGVSKLGRAKYRDEESDDVEVENMRRFILAVSKDIRVVLIKLADRLHNMETIGAMPPLKQKRIALETLEIYGPLAYRLGMFDLYGRLEDLSFPIAHPQEARWLKERVTQHYEERQNYVKKITPLVKQELESHNIKLIRLEARAKRPASLYRKLLKYEMNLDRIYDLVALRCIVPKIEDCYMALGVVHNKWRPMPKRFKDYIAMPKPNGYRSLHTTVFGPDNITIEIQMRTEQMDDEAENGIAAHWQYQQKKDSKDYKKRLVSFANQKDIALVNQLRSWQKTLTDQKEFLQSLKIDFLQDRILAITPRGKVIDLPEGSTAVDFAYQIHTEIGNSCIGARVNGRIFPLDKPLDSGDVVEILIQKNKRPSASWLAFIKTSQARGHIKAAVKQKDGVLKIPEVNKTEFRILTEDRIGVLKDVCAIISRSHVNITEHRSEPYQKNDSYRLIKITCALSDRNKASKIAEKIRKIKGFKSVESRLA